ncbi:MAG: Gfo/Idh/MocA family oxidoreductase [Candidatus Latescibacterota bacterium]
MDAPKLRFAMFGTGVFGQIFAPYINEVAELVSICDPSPEARSAFREKTGLALPEFDNAERLLAEVDIDAVALTGPNHTHKPLALAAARAGKHVYCEKTMAPTVPNCWEMVRACEAAGVRLMVGHKRRIRPPWARMIQLCDQLGPVYAISSCKYHDSSGYNPQGWWWRDAECGGTLPLVGVHTIDWMRAMCGDVESVSALAAPQINSHFDYPDTMHVSLRFRSGAVGALSVSASYPILQYREACSSDVITREGGMRIQTYLDHIDLSYRRRDDSETHYERFDDLGHAHAFRKELGDFVRWVTEGAEPCLTWREGLRCVEVMEAAHHYSARQNGRWVDLPLYPELEAA